MNLHQTTQLNPAETVTTTIPAGASEFIIGPDSPILITGASGFIGSRLIEVLLDFGFRNLVCFVRPSSDASRLESIVSRRANEARIAVVKGNLLSRQDCEAATKDATVVFHLAAARGEKSFPDAFMNSVVTTRNLLEATLQNRLLRRFVNVSSFSVYSNTQKPHQRLLDETCPIEARPDLRGDAYCFAKVKQEELVTDYSKRFRIPCVIVRPGYVYGPGNAGITGRVGIGTFGVFLHLGGFNAIPFTYVDNCAEAIALAGLRRGVDGEVFNVVDDNLLSSWQFLRLYKRNVKQFNSLYVPHFVSYLLCYLWEQYSNWSEGQLPLAFTRRKWHASWKQTYYSNKKLKRRLGWTPKVSMAEGLKRYFEACKDKQRYA